MPELFFVAAAVSSVTAATAGAAAVLQAGVVIASPAEDLVIGGSSRSRAIPRRPRVDPTDAAASATLLHTDGLRRNLLLASRIGLRAAVPFGPRSYVSMARGACMAPEIPAGAPLLIDPDANPQPGDFVVIWAAGAGWIAGHDSRARQVLLEDGELLEPDEWVAGPGCWAYGKRLVRPLPPRSSWQDDTGHSLVVETLNPAMEYRSNLAEVAAIDKVVGVLDFSADPAFAELWRRAARDRGLD